MIIKYLVVLSVIFSISRENVMAQLKTSPHLKEKTCFQTSAPWKADYDVRADVAIIYGMNDSFNERVKGWKERGYGIHFMTGIAWGGRVRLERAWLRYSFYS